MNVELRNENGRAVARTVTDHAGHFFIAPANSGVYSLDAVKPGFKSAIKIVQLPRSATVPISIALDAETALSLPVSATYSAHYISQDFQPDNVAELLYQGVASTAFHSDLDDTLEGDLTYKLRNHTPGAGFLHRSILRLTCIRRSVV